MNLKPELLTHPQIPKALAGVNPRNIIGLYRWDDIRAEIAHKQGFQCASCGILKNNLPKNNYLECHENYEINYSTGEVKFMEFVSICTKCHQFIHIGLWKQMYKTGKISMKEFSDILFHGMQILRNAGLEPNPYTQMEWLYLTRNMSDSEVLEELTMGQRKTLIDMNKVNVPWENWHLVFNGKKYYSKFKDLEDWKKHYRR